MEFDLATNIEQCFILIRDEVPLNIIYYSHIPTALISLTVGLFIFIKSRHSLISKVLLNLALAFSLWLLCDLITWTNYDSRKIMFSWSLFPLLDTLFFTFSLYFVHVFIYKKDLDFFKKIIILILILPIVFFTPTSFNLNNFNIDSCLAVENNYVNYVILFELIIFFWIVVSLIRGYRKSDNNFKHQIIYLSFGIIFFLLSFFITGLIPEYFGSYLGWEGYLLEPYGLFGMTVFIGFLTFLTVKYKAFNIKLIGAQALVVTLIILIGSQFAFIQTRTNMILNGITFVLVCSFGWVLIKSVKAEVERKEQLQIMTEKLAVANDKLRKLDNAKTEFISIASHQLRTPLTAVKGYVSLILEGSYGPITPEQKNVLSSISISNERLINLVEDLLNISRIESGRMEFNFEACNVADLCREIYDTFVLRAKDRNLFLKLDLVRALELQVKTDRNKLREVVSNLVDNAIKYTPAGGVKMRAYRNEDKVRIEVTDTGIGIPQTEMPYLFAKFSRGKDTSRLNAGGTGLGLHVGKSMIEALHGKIWAESEGDKKGSTFIVELPMTFEEETE